MNHAEDMHETGIDPVNDDVRQGHCHQFARVLRLADSTTVRKRLQRPRCVVELSYRLTRREKGGARANIRECLADHRLRPGPSEFASGLEHPLNTGVYFFFLNKLAASDLADSHLHLLLKPLGVGKQSAHGLLHQVVGAPSGLDGKLVELGFLILWQTDFHDDNLRIARSRVKISRPERFGG